MKMRLDKEYGKRYAGVHPRKLHLFYNGPFSQWHPLPMEIDGTTYNSAEQYMMAKKALVFKDKDAYRRIMDARWPSEQKAIGRTLRGYSDAVWHSVARDVVLRANLKKFRRGSPLCQYLLGTLGQIIVEASPTDTVWGIGLAEDDPAALDPTKWRGSNWLGEVLMEVRTRLWADVAVPAEGWTTVGEHVTKLLTDAARVPA